MKNSILIVIFSLATSAVLVQCGSSNNDSVSVSGSSSEEQHGGPILMPLYVSCQDGNGNTTCLNGGTCRLQGRNMYKCSCPAGFHGIRCELTVCQRMNNAGSVVSACENGGACTSSGNSVSCTCLTGFSGRQCQIQSCESSPAPCLNGATCANRRDGRFQCTCSTAIPQYTGEKCDKRFCDLNKCNNSTCTNYVNGTLGGTCTCQDGFSGTYCNKPVCPTTYALCQNGGVCTNTGNDNSFRCDCSATAYGGRVCERLACEMNPCRNGGTCVNMVGKFGYTCTCAAGWGGVDCKVRANNRG